MKSRALLAVVFVIGCATGGIASQLVIPPVRAGTAPTRWEYLCLQEHADDMAAYNKAGAAGWEMVSASSIGNGNYATVCFKRALP